MSRNSNFTETECQGTIVLETTCPFCGKKQMLVLEGNRAIAYKQGKESYERGMLMQNAFPFLTADEREFIMTGICHDCWENV
jgi:hypothetical protein